MEIMTPIVSNCYEFNLIFQVFMWAITNEYSFVIPKIYNMPDSTILELGSYLIKATQIKLSNIESLYEDYVQYYRLRRGSFYMSCVNPTILKRVFLILQLKISEIMDKNILPTGDVSIFSPSGSHQYNFTESALIHFVTTTDYSSLHELFEKTTKLGSVPEGGLQITEIAINEGSTKTFVNSILTETVQNSLDAIRTKLPINTYIDLRLEKCAEHKIIFSITDYVGMEMNGIIATMIPFLSSKTPSEIVTGEMGSGFFNVYRESKKVLIKTVHNSKAVIILDTPVHDKNNRVVDIKRSVQIKKSDESNHTTIYVLICAQNAFEYTDIISDFLFMIQNVMTLIEGANIRFNDKEIGIKTETLYDTEHFNFQINVNDWMITESYIFTKGVPFASLHNYFSDKNVIQQFVLDGLEYNSVLNIKHGLFTPVQTRAKLNISPKNFKLLTDFLYNSLYLQ